MFSCVARDAILFTVLKQRVKVEVKYRTEGWKRDYCSETLQLGDKWNRLCCWIIGNVCFRFVASCFGKCSPLGCGG